MSVASMQTVAMPAPSAAQPASASAAANPLSASPVLSEPDAYYASLAGSTGALAFGGSEATKPLFVGT